MERLLEPWLRGRRIKLVMPYIKRGGVVCDAGCGTKPTLLISMSKLIKKGFGIDKKAQLKQELPDNIKVKRANIEGGLPFKAGCFDSITMLAVLEHLNNPMSVLKNCLRMLKKGGRLIITIPSKKSRLLLETLAFLRIVDEQEIREHKNYWGGWELKTLLEKAGFKNITIREYNLKFNLLAVGER